MSTPAHSPMPRTATHAVADEVAQPGVQVHRRVRLSGIGIRRARSIATTVRADRGRQRVAAERRAVLTGMQHAEDVAIGDHCGQRNHAAAERFAEQVDVGHHAPVVAGERAPGAGQAGLDLVGDHQHVALGAQRAHPRQVVVGRHDDARLALDGLEQHGDGVLVDGGGQSRRRHRRAPNGSPGCTGRSRGGPSRRRRS